ncbi:MAG: hypothetical protein ABI893_05085 [Polaromonas sp.]|uniref:hypothetical protein n=1 Tax=Polaromonas sp. TaxID=1869339 RepID=UPI0032675F38
MKSGLTGLVRLAHGELFESIAYHSSMRHLLFALMIALLPLRGWVGDAMATQMAASHVQHAQHASAEQSATKTIAAPAHHTGAEGHSSHEEMSPESSMAMHNCAEQTTDSSIPVNDTGCESCAACQACHTVALSPAALDHSVVFEARSLPLPAPNQFASADAALGQKPPIS